jgi:uroporphyrinogen decarboxylase
MPGGGYFFDGAWLQYWGTGNEETDLTLYAREAERIYKETSYATNFVGYGHGEGFGAFFGDIDRLVRMLDNPDAVTQENEVRCEEYIKRAGKIIDSMGKYIQLLSMSDDMGMQHGPMCKPSIVEQCVAPFIKKFCEFIHRNSDIKVFMHNCGSIKPLIPILIDCGVDVLNPVQISAADMNPQDLKQEFGDNIIFWGGGCDTQNILGTATPRMVADHVRELIRIFKPGGGFVFNQVHNIMGDVPPENIVAMLDTAYEESFY